MRFPAQAGRALRFSAVAAITLVLLFATFAIIAATETDGISVPAAQAAGTINVTTYDDQYNTDPGKCSLREAIQAVNDGTDFGGCSNPGGTADTVQLLAGTYVLTRTGTGATWNNQNGSLYFSDRLGTLAILGAGPTQTVISTTNSFNDRVFFFHPNGSESTMSILIDGVTIRGGNVSSGAGISTEIVSPDASFQLKNSAVEYNTASGTGGGLEISYGAGQVTITNVTFHSNEAGYGGGFYYEGRYTNDTLDMENVTVYGNTATSSGGGIYLGYTGYTPGGITLTNVTIAENKASTSGGNFYNNGRDVEFQNTIIADAVAGGDCAGSPGPNITSLGYNLDSDGSCGLDATGDITGTDPLLDSQLRDNGGDMETLALLEGSPALNQCADCPPTDQRGWFRVTPGPCDMGAYERWVRGLSLPMVLKNE
jgi:CSLREA domain-containing protein